MKTREVVIAMGSREPPPDETQQIGRSREDSESPPSTGVTQMGLGDLVAPSGSGESPVNGATPIEISKLGSPLGPAESQANGVIPIGPS